MYDFNISANRRGTDCVKWDETKDENIVPMWVADMDFRVAQPIIDALQKRVSHGVFGYALVPDSYYDAVINWFDRRHGWKMQREHIIYTTGVVPAISAIIKAVALPGEKVLVQTPIYNCFLSCVRNCGCQIEAAPLKCVEVNDHAPSLHFEIDFAKLEAKLADPKTTVMLLCNPHNPTGRVWTRDELMRIGELCLKHNVFVVSDEIHCEFVLDGETPYTPFATLSKEIEQNCAVCTAPSKAFNIAGLQTANITVANNRMRQRIDRWINIHEVCDINPFGIVALQAAYNECSDWLDELNTHITANYHHLCMVFAEQMPKLKVTKMEGTYLVWVDFSAFGKPSEQIEQELLERHLWINNGSMYDVHPSRFMRINIACPRQQLDNALEIMRKFYCNHVAKF